MTASKKAAVEAPATEDTPQDPATHIKIDTTRNVHQRLNDARRTIRKRAFSRTWPTSSSRASASTPCATPSRRPSSPPG